MEQMVLDGGTMLQQQIDKNRQKIHTDAYAISLGELVNLYRDGELVIHPAYQRLFRWSDEQKSRWIDSILLGIPLPSIFVAQRPNGVWEVVDGLQRIATILQLVGVLKDEKEQPVSPLVLTKTKHLPALDGKRWGDDEEAADTLDSAQRLLIKRAKIDVKIVLKESDLTSKYELFQRLNTGGSPLSEQEIRTCLLIMTNPGFANWLSGLAADPNFTASTTLSEAALDRQDDRELVTRFLVFRRLDATTLNNIGDLNEFMTESLLKMADDPSYDTAVEEAAFKATFAEIASSGGADLFRRFDVNKGEFMGMFLKSMFEVIAIGLGFHEPGWSAPKPDYLLKFARAVWQNTEFTNNSGAGVRASTRVKKTIPIGRVGFQK